MKLSGQDAFDKVLEAALDAHVKAREAVRKQHEAEERSRDATSAATRAHSIQHEAEAERSKLQAEASKALPKLAELWQAAKSVDDTIRVCYSNGSTITPASDCIKRLRDALEAAAGYCDDIPF
jgi:uncharacterized membrane protein YqiK